MTRSLRIAAANGEQVRKPLDRSPHVPRVSPFSASPDNLAGPYRALFFRVFRVCSLRRVK